MSRVLWLAKTSLSVYASGCCAPVGFDERLPLYGLHEDLEIRGKVRFLWQGGSEISKLKWHTWVF
jgi:hypothetical protein